MKENRREFIKNLSGLGLGIMAGNHIPFREVKIFNDSLAGSHDICVFSKHLQFLEYEEMAETAATIGFDGVDLCVRPGGHVEPEKVKTDLPRAIKAIRKAGLKAPMMVTAITDPEDPNTVPVLETAAGLGIQYYRMGYLPYDFKKGVAASLKEHQPKIDGLVKLNEKYKIRGNYQNHDGTNVGASVWDIWELIKKHDPEWIGCQFDIRHATVEGGHSWPVDMNLIAPYIQTIVIKDFRWGEKNGRMQVIDTPVGEGMVDFKKYFSLLKPLWKGGPVTMHFEYEMTDRPEKEMTKPEIKKQVMPAMTKDLKELKNFMREAGLL